ncbi:D-alanyl-D-alanine carboxypeptidase/D-alanyl-D-alanine endopeptidase [Motilibacter aurantiacus]|uniref:D-alanyl-D-alanine carboxypeptidase/D-alanyl-D-alanine endopeptidase n=1 Tax=Motilibacter aurantiacus TaxID=2714955 RepID=UPI00140CF39C|nr:D-alanyl-D-alanine carboxypeptidase/D-alanyl-D-alanine-endopeptidase [Motilibacter aurantiacus]
MRHRSRLGLAVLSAPVAAAVAAGLLTSGGGSDLAQAASAAYCPSAGAAPTTPAPADGWCQDDEPSIRPRTPAPAATRAAAPTADEKITALVPSRIDSLGIGGQVAAYVKDLATGQELVASSADSPLMPASTTKLATAVTALTALGPDTRFTTRALLRGSALTISGGGDASLTTRAVQTLANRAAVAAKSAGKRRVSVVVDDSYFPRPTNARGWSRGYVPGSVSPVRALDLDQRVSMDTSMLAGRAFAAQLERRGVTVTSVRRGRAPAAAVEVAAVQGSTLSAIVRQMLQVSDNDIAENLARHVAVSQGFAPDWAGAAAARTAVLVQLGVPLTGVRIDDGSGLSRTTRLTARALVTLLELAADPARPELAAVIDGGLPTAGKTGSLRPARGRFVTAPSKCATGKLWAKTGLLRDVVSLAGVTYGKDGELKAFAVVVNGPRSTLTLRRKIDALAATVTGCW